MITVLVALWLTCAGLPGLDAAALAPPPEPDPAYSRWVLALVEDHDRSLLVLQLGRMGISAWMIAAAIAAWRRIYVPMVALVPLALCLLALGEWLIEGDFVAANHASAALDHAHQERVLGAFGAVGRVAGEVAYQHQLLLVWCGLLSALACVSWWRAHRRHHPAGG